MPNRDFSPLQKDILRIMYQWQGCNYKPCIREEAFLKSNAFHLSNIISPDLLFMEYCLRSDRLIGGRQISLPKLSARVAFTRSLRSLICTGTIYGFLPIIHKTKDFTLLGRMDTDRGNIYKQRLIGVALTVEGFRQASALAEQSELNAKRRERKHPNLGKIFIVYFYPTWGTIYPTTAKGKPIDGLRRNFKSRQQGVKQFKRLMNQTLKDE